MGSQSTSVTVCTPDEFKNTQQLEPQNHTTHLPQPTTDFASFRQAIISGCKKYISKRENHLPARLPDCGLFHGKKGMVKSQKIKNIAEKIQNGDKESLLILALALYHSSSKWLATEIAQIMIEGKYHRDFSINNGKTETTNTLTSNVFNHNRLDNSLRKPVLQTNVIANRSFTLYVKRKAVRHILEEEIASRIPNTTAGKKSMRRINFDDKVQRLKSHLRDTENLSIKPCCNILGISS